MEPIYLNDWAEGGFFGVVADFEDIYMTKADYEAAESPYPNVDMWLENKAKMKAALDDPKWRGIEILLASYGYANYSGDAFVLFRRDGKLYRVDAGHCSCYGLEGQWEPQETNAELLRHEMEQGRLGGDKWCENNFGIELRGVLDRLQLVN